MTWRNLKRNPPGGDCDMLCRIDYGAYADTFVARYHADRRKWVRTNSYGLPTGPERSLESTNESTLYIVIDEIKP